MSTSAPAEKPLPETNIVVLGGLLAGDTLMDWLKPEAAKNQLFSHRLPKPRPSSFYIWTHSGPQLITALSEGRGYGEAGGEGLFAWWQISESLTHRFAVPPLPQAGEGCCQLTVLGQTNIA